MLTSVICSSTCVQLASTSRISNCFLDRTNPTGLFVSRLTKTTMYCPDLLRFHLCLVVSIDTNLFWFFFYWCVLPLTKLLHLSVHYSEQRCGHCSLLAWLFLILVGWYIYIFYLQNLSPRLVQVLHLNCLRLTLQSNLICYRHTTITMILM